MRLVLTLSLFLLSFFSSGQSLFMQGVDTPWTSGELTLNDGTQYKGVIKYNEQIGSITYKSDTLAKESKTFSEDDLLALEMFDETLRIDRKFYSFPVDQEQKEIYLFEVIREFQNWAVLSRKSGLKVLDPKNKLYPDGNYTTTAKVSQVEYFFIIDENGVMTLFFAEAHTERDGWLGYQQTQGKVYDQDFLLEKMSPFHDNVETYAKKNELKFKKKADFIKILDYYEKLVKN